MIVPDIDRKTLRGGGRGGGGGRRKAWLILMLFFAVQLLSCVGVSSLSRVFALRNGSLRTSCRFCFNLDLLSAFA